MSFAALKSRLKQLGVLTTPPLVSPGNASTTLDLSLASGSIGDAMTAL
jgi:hypothetical protein